MGFAFAIALLSSMFTASCVLIVQGIQAQLRERRIQAQKIAGELIENLETKVTPCELAKAMGATEFQAHDLLCSMVDDYYFTMVYDRERAEFRFGFTERHSKMRANGALPAIEVGG